MVGTPTGLTLLPSCLQGDIPEWVLSGCALAGIELYPPTKQGQKQHEAQQQQQQHVGQQQGAEVHRTLEATDADSIPR